MMDLCNFPFKGQNSRWDNRAKEKDVVVMDKEKEEAGKSRFPRVLECQYTLPVSAVTSTWFQKDLLMLSCFISFLNTHSSKVLHLCFTNLQQWQNVLLSLQHSHILCPSPSSWHQILGVERAQQDAWCKGQAGRKVHQHQKGPRPYNVTTQLGV